MPNPDKELFRIKSGLPPDMETQLIERMSDAGYTIGMDEDGRNEWWPPEDESQQ